ATDREEFSELSATTAYTASDLGGGQTLITAELPLSYAHRAGFNLSLTYFHNSVTDDRGYTTLEFTHWDPVKIFSITNPGTVYITDQLDKQGLSFAKPEAQATWYLNLALRAFRSTNPDENQITIYDNGTPVYSYDVGAGALNHLGLGTTDRLRIRLTDNLNAGIHVVWANRTLDGETVSTEPVVFTLAEGRSDNTVRVSDLWWWHWNHRISWDENEPDQMHYDNLSDLAGENIWIWPGKKHQMRFTVKNATSDELDGVNLVYQALWAQSNTFWDKEDPKKYGYSRSIASSGFKGYNTVTRAIPCTLIEENKAGNYSVWGIDEFYVGYLQGFEFEFDYNAAIDAELAGMTTEELSDLETDAFYKSNALGDVPDDAEQIAAIRNMSAEERTAAIADMSEASHALQGLDLKITEDNETRMKMELKTPTKELSEYTVTMEKGGTMELPDILKLMEKERSEGNQNPSEKGWDVTWAQFETLQGTTLMRIASFDGKDPSTGRNALLTHTTYYITKSVADALENDGAALSTASLAAVGEDVAKPDHWTKQLYDGTSIVYSTSDLTDEAWKAYCKANYLKANPGDLEGAAAFANSESLIPKKLDTTMKVLGVADTIITYAKGPSGADPSGLRQLLKNVRDEKARRSLEMQIKDYETLRYDIYKQDCAMSTYSTASNFSPMGPIGKVVVFVGGLANGVISGWSKDYNRQVYNTTLHDIQLQIKYEAVKQERLKKSFMDAEKWLRDKMDSIYGKGNWSEYALAEERKNWVLKEYPGGILKYVWKDKAGEFTVTQDPSGYVYESVNEDTVQGVTASLYYSDAEDGSYSLWSDPYREQPNPQITGDTGNYMWMVPTGWWKVRYEKDGYSTSESKAMPVPPVHTTVNIGLLSEDAPKAEVKVGEGKITVLFTKYMQLESLIRLFGDEQYTDESFDGSAFGVQFYDADGVSIPGTVTFPDRRENTGYKGNDYGTDVIDSDWFVRSAVFTPSDTTKDLSGVTWRFAEGMTSYAGVALDGETSALHVIRLDPNGGWLDRDATVTDEQGKLAALPEPTRENFTFLGWFTKKEGGAQMTAGDAFDADCTLYAHWGTAYLTVREHTNAAGVHTFGCTVNPQGKDVTVYAASYSSAGQMLDVTAYSAGKDVTSQNFTVTLKEKANDSIFKFVIVNSKTGEPLDEYQYYGLNP
ncbi:MAG: InlB B-repeat-containing protein, partial [Clostridia bacterium]|nr:InlB B-repeat-containing protein [Clostridia bacterium]